MRALAQGVAANSKVCCMKMSRAFGVKSVTSSNRQAFFLVTPCQAKESRELYVRTAR